MKETRGMFIQLSNLFVDSKKRRPINPLKLALGAIFILSVIHFWVLYEHFPRPGFVDAGMYAGYSLNTRLYEVYEPNAGHNYQGSRLGYILPLIASIKLLGEVHGRLALTVALYICFAASLLSISHQLSRNQNWISVFAAPFFFLPLVIASVTYGGSDGVAMAAQLMAIALSLRAMAARSSFASQFLSGCSGGLSAVAISSHIFAIFPILLFVMYLVISWKRSLWVSAFVSFASVLVVIDFIARDLGFHDFFLTYSVPWISASLSGSGEEYAVLSESFALRSYLWVPIFALATIFLFFMFTGWREEFFSSGPSGWVDALRWALPALALCSTSLAFIVFDYWIGGNLLASPPYLAIVLPSLIFYIILGVEQYVGPFERGGSLGRFWIFVLVVYSLPIAQYSGSYFQPAFKWNGTNSRSLYESQVEFLESLRSVDLDKQKVWIIFKSAEPSPSSRVYSDSFNGRQRAFDYLDSIVALFLWDRSILRPASGNRPTSLALTNMMTFFCNCSRVFASAASWASRLVSSGNALTPVKRFSRLIRTPRPVVVLGRNSYEVQNILRKISCENSQGKQSALVCNQQADYPWCWRVLSGCYKEISKKYTKFNNM